MRGAERVTITDPAALSINDNLTVVLPTFKLTTLFSSASAADMGIMNLNNGSVIAKLNSTTGAMDITFDDADGGVDETVSTTKVSWAADTEWQVAFTLATAIAGTISVRLYINGVAENTNDQCDTVLTIPAGDTTYGYDGTTCLTGKITRGPMVWSTAIVSEANLLLVYKGIPFATNLVLQHQLDEGRGLAVDDKATGAACDGVISGTNTANIWDYDVRQVCMGLDGRTGYAVSAAGVDISGDVTSVWAGKVKSTYDTLATRNYLMTFHISVNDRFILYYYNVSNEILFTATGAGTAKEAAWSVKPAIDDYLIIIATISVTGAVQLFINGSLIDSDTALPAISNAAATAYLGRDTTLYYDVSKPIFVPLIDGAFNGKQVLQYSRDLDNWLGTGLTI